MIIHGSMADNLTAALRSSRRLRGSRVHGDTIAFWRALVAQARAQSADGDAGQALALGQLADRLEEELALIEGE